MPEPVATRFARSLDLVRDGRAAEEASAALSSLIEQVQLTQKGGKLTLTLDIQPNGLDSVMVDALVSVKPPQPKRAITPLYIHPEEGLSRRKPGQLSLDDLQDTTKR